MFFPRNQVGAFVTWGLWAGGPQRQNGFFKFIDAATKTPITEKIFHENFGFDYAAFDQMWKKNGLFLLGTISLHPSTGSTARPVAEADVALATSPQIARIMGAAYVAEGTQSDSRALNPGMLIRARTVLSGAYNEGDRDPRLLAALGFLELASGERERAKDYLVQSAAAKILRPRVYLELARIRFAEAIAKAPTLDEATATYVLAPLRIAQTQLPEMQSTYELLVEIDLRRSTPVHHTEQEVLEANVWPCDDTARLVWKTALLFARNRREEDAAQLIKTALREHPAVRRGSLGTHVFQLIERHSSVGYSIGPPPLLGNNDLVVFGTGQRQPASRPWPTRERQKLAELLHHLEAADGQWMNLRADEFDTPRSP